MHKSTRRLSAFALVGMMLLALASSAMAAPNAPQGMKLKKGTANSLTFVWTKTKTAVKYEIYRSESEDGEYARIATVKTNSFTNTKLLAGTTYYYYICALDKKGERSEESEKFAVSTKAAAGANTAATNATLDAEYAKVVDTSKIMTSVNEQYLQLLNAERAKAGAKPLTLSQELMKTAAIKAADMYNNNYFNYDHSSPTYGDLQTFAKKMTGHQIAENIMDADSGWTSEYSNAAIMGNDKFMNSSSHRANRLTANYKTVGFCVYNGGNKIVIVEHFYF